MRAVPRLALVALAALSLAGCVASEPGVVPPPEPTATPVFASDEEALAAATEAYAAYLEMSDLIAQEGGANPERLAPFVTAAALDKQVGQLAGFQENALSSSGRSAFDTVTLQQSADSELGISEIIIYLCLDVANVRIHDAEGVDVTPIDRQNRLPLEVGFDAQSRNERLLLTQSELWNGANFC